MSKRLRRIATLVVAIIGAGIAGCSTQPAPASADVRISYVAFHTLDETKPLAEAGVLRVPLRTGRIPAVVIVHGSAGVDSRGAAYASALNDAGIATFEIDMWAARGITGPESRPTGVPETLPDAYAAFKLLAAHPSIDPARIGIMGFSWGGVVSMLTTNRGTTTRYLSNDARFAAHAPNYPVCWVYNRVPGYELKDLTGAPVLLQAGALDTYDLPDTCVKLVDSLPAAAAQLFTVKVYPDAPHGWDRIEPPVVVNDPFSHLGKGGEVRIAPHAPTAALSRAATVAFFRCKLALAGCP